jgi:hypothetical protein
MFAVIAVFAIVLTAACYAVRRLEARPSRLVAVLTALALLVGALVPVVRLLTESVPRSSGTVDPVSPGGTALPAAPSASAPGSVPTAAPASVPAAAG